MGRTKGNMSVKKPAKVKKTFEQSQELKDLAEKVINEQKIDIYPSKVDYLLVYPHISKTVAGKCIKASKELKHYSTFDYVIEMSGELWDSLDDATRYILMHHELMHAQPVMNEKSGDWDFKIRDHDVKDFALIISKHGIDWISKVKLSVASLYEVDPADVNI